MYRYCSLMTARHSSTKNRHVDMDYQTKNSSHGGMHWLLSSAAAQAEAARARYEIFSRLRGSPSHASISKALHAACRSSLWPHGRAGPGISKALHAAAWLLAWPHGRPGPALPWRALSWWTTGLGCPRHYAASLLPAPFAAGPFAADPA